VLTITATAATNYQLETLTVNGANFTSGQTHIVVGATVIAASFKEIPSTSINPTEISTPITVWVSNDVLHIKGLVHGEQYRIYTVSGTLVHHGIATSDIVRVENFQPPKTGIYILHTTTHSVKFMW
jgi:hypothetical protein